MKKKKNLLYINQNRLNKLWHDFVIDKHQFVQFHHEVFEQIVFDYKMR